jgi:hypothetical protein
VDADAALKGLTEISSQVEAAVLLAADGTTLASTIEDGERRDRLAAAIRALVEASSEDGRRLVQLEAATSEGSVFVAQDEARLVAAVTKPEPTAGLVFFDLKSCLTAAAADEGDGKPRPRARRVSKPTETKE